MGKTKQLLIWLARSIVILLVLLVAFAFLLPTFFVPRSVEEKLSAEIERAAGSRIEFKELSVSILPRPRVLLKSGRITQPVNVSGTIKSLQICPRVFPLLSGKIKIARLELDAPRLTLQIPKISRPDETWIPNILIIKEKVLSQLSHIQSMSEGAHIRVKEGKLGIFEDKEEIFSFEKIDADVSVNSKGFDCSFSSGSNLWEDLSLNIRLEPRPFFTKGSVALVQLHPQLLGDYLFPSARQRLGESHVNLDLHFEANGFEKVNLAFKSSIPGLAIMRDEEKVLVKGAAEGSLNLNSGRTMLSFSKLDFENPRFVAVGSFFMDPKTPKTGLELLGENVDADSVREVALALLGKYKGVRDTFRVVKGGQVPVIGVKAQGRSPADLGEFINYTIEGDMIDGTIYIPDVELEVKNAKGHAVISQTVLEGSNLEGTTVGDSIGRDGTLKIGLEKGEGGSAPFELNIDLDADLAQLPPVLERVVKDKDFLRELALMKEVRGRAKGRLILGENLNAVKAKVDAREFNLHCHYGRIPYAADIGGGPFLYQGTMVSGKSLSGKLGTSSFSDVEVLVDWGSESRVEVSTSNANEVFLDEIHPWLASYSKVKEFLKGIESVRGTLAPSNLDLKGPLFKPGDWQFRMKGRVQDLVVTSVHTPESLAVKSGSIEADQDDFTIVDWQTSLLDASAMVSGKIKGYLAEIKEADLTFRGGVGAKANQWVSDLFHLAPELRLRSPVSLKQTHLIWKKNGGIDFSGDMHVEGGPRLVIDMAKTPSGISVKNLLVKDNLSDASLVIDLDDRKFDFVFVGRLNNTSVDRLLQTNEFIQGQIAGDLRAHILLDQPMSSTAKGRLDISGFRYVWGGLGPISIEKAAVDASGQRLMLESGSLNWVDNHLDLTGSIDFSEAGFLLDMDLQASGLDWEDLSRLIESKNQGMQKDRSFWRLPLRGTVRANAASFSYKNLVWKPIKGTISFSPEGEDIDITEAILCGIPTPANVKVLSETLQIDVKPNALNQETGPSLVCLWNEDKEGLIVGTFDLAGEVTLRENKKSLAGDGLVRSLEGDLEFSAKDGRIYRWTILSKIFSLINVTEIFRGKLPDLVNEGFAYDFIKAKGQFEDGKLIIDEAIIDGASMKMVWTGDLDLVNKTMDFTVLVAPLRTVDRIVEYIPFVGYVLGDTLISVPVKVSGAMADPTVFPLSPSAVGSKLLGYMERVFNLPLRVIQPLMK